MTSTAAPWRQLPCCGAVLAVLGLLAGCSSTEEPAVQEVASSFAGGDPQGRCDLLAPTTLEALLHEEPSCPEGLEQLPLGTGEVVSIEVWGSDAQVHLTDDTLFLTRDGAAWRVSAAACRPGGDDGPYSCQLEGS